VARTCLICNNNRFKVVFNEFGIDILRCKDCGHVFSSYVLDQNYDKYFGDDIFTTDDLEWWDIAHKDMYDSFCRKYIENKSGRLLDVGCGLGFFVKRVGEYSSWEVYGYEIAGSAVDYARDVLKLDNIFNGRVEGSNFPSNHFDLITMWDVIEHLPQPDIMLSYLYGILKPDGILFLHTPNVVIQLAKARLKRLMRGMRAEVHYLEPKDHMHIYSMKTITRLLNRNGFNRLKFTHLDPIQSVSGSRKRQLVFAKNLWYGASKTLFQLSFGRLNFDNLFIEAVK